MKYDGLYNIDDQSLRNLEKKMSEVFNKYTGQCTTELQQIKRAVLNLANQSNSKKQSLIKQIRNQLYDCQKSIKLSQTQLVSFKGKQKNIASQKIKTFKTQLQIIKKKIMQIEQDINQQKTKDLLLTSHSLQLSQQGNKYKKLSDNQVTDNLKQSVKVMYETMDMGDSIQYQLQGQSKKMIQNKHKLAAVTDQLKKGERVIKKMMLRIRRNKLLMWSIVAFVLLLIVVIIWKILG